MNTVICYLTALAMQFMGMNIACESNSVSTHTNPPCEAQRLYKKDTYPSKEMGDLSPNFFFQERTRDGKQYCNEEQIIG